MRMDKNNQKKHTYEELVELAKTKFDTISEDRGAKTHIKSECPVGSPCREGGWERINGGWRKTKMRGDE